MSLDTWKRIGIVSLIAIALGYSIYRYRDKPHVTKTGERIEMSLPDECRNPTEPPFVTKRFFGRETYNIICANSKGGYDIFRRRLSDEEWELVSLVPSQSKR